MAIADMPLTEYNEAETMELFREEGRTEGFIDAMIALTKDGIISVSVGASRAGISEEAFRKQMAM